MKKVIGIVGEGPTDFLVIREIMDHITGEENDYMRLQPEPDMAGQFGNGWKGVWKWCESMSDILDSFFYEITPKLDLLVIQMDSDVCRKEQEVHCLCEATVCEYSGKTHPLQCKRAIEKRCPITLPCTDHIQNPIGSEEHLEELIRKWLGGSEERRDILIAIPCDSTDAWIAAAYEKQENIEIIQNPWENIIAKSKEYHGIRIPGGRKKVSVYAQFIPQLCRQWESVTQKCYSARSFEQKVRTAFIDID